MLNAILFDLDGTLLPLDTDQFLHHYLKLLAAKMEPFMQPELFTKQLLAATAAMIGDVDPNKTNAEVFKEAFFAATNLHEEQIMAVFTDFYANEYCQLKNLIKPNPLAKEIMAAARKTGRKLVLATNPVFPREAIKERVKWAGVDETCFDLITCYETMHYCKPNQHYFLEIAEKLGLEPEHCLMVGNDVDEDLIAQEIGMQTFLVEDFLINRKNTLYSSLYQGNLHDLYRFISKIECRR